MVRSALGIYAKNTRIGWRIGKPGVKGFSKRSMIYEMIPLPEMSPIGVAIPEFLICMGQLMIVWALIVLTRHSEDVLDVSLLTIMHVIMWSLLFFAADRAVNGFTVLGFHAPLWLIFCLKTMSSLTSMAAGLLFVGLVKRYRRVLCYRHRLVALLREINDELHRRRGERV